MRMKICPINKNGEPKSLQEYKTEREARERAQMHQVQARDQFRMLASILK